LLQLRNWGKLKGAHGWQPMHASIANPQGKLLGAALLLMRTLPLRVGKIAYIPCGPVVDWDRPDLVDGVINTTLKQAHRHGAMAVVMEPDLFDTPSDRHLLKQLGFVQLDFHVQPRRTICVNLDVDEEVDLLAAMKQKTRYNIGLAKRKGIVVRPSANTPADIATFYNMMQVTADRDTFGIHAQRYYEDFMALFAPETARLLIAEHEGQALAGLIVTAVGARATYLYGASTNEKRELMPTYLLQWEAMRWARAQGCVSYDLWGVPDEDEDFLEANFEARHEGLWGVYRFKRGFGGQVVRRIGAWTKVLSPVRWRLYELARKVRKTTGLGN
jgi:lipid II:glycine glycyltransferase (peptidoglycan interpeptide bridge formation enzyme)